MSLERVVQVHYEISEICESEWNRCASSQSPDCNPFVDHRFLRALEASGSTCAETGWQPFHIRISENGDTVGVVPMYLKSHSRGEFVFDSGWAAAFDSAGGCYYPKLQVSVPFTPATGPRLLTAESSKSREIEEELLAAAVTLAEKIDVSSVHITFLCKNQWDMAGKLGLLQRVDTQFHWQNLGFDTFEDFLGTLSSRKRKNIRRERRAAIEDGVSIQCLTGSDLEERHWDAFYHCYVHTGYRKWGTPYLTRAFFSLVAQSMPEHILLVMCRRGSRYIAGAINFIGNGILYGRNWGCVEHHPFLHFEACYYQAIEFAIRNRLQSVEAGAGGGHKLSRGYLPKPTYSAHWMRDRRLRDAIATFLDQERSIVQEDVEFLETRTPYKQTLDLASYRSRV